MSSHHDDLSFSKVDEDPSPSPEQEPVRIRATPEQEPVRIRATPEQEFLLAPWETYLRPYLPALLDYKTNPIARRFILLADIVDAVPTWLIDLFVPLVLGKDSSLTIPINLDVPFHKPVHLPIKIPGLPDSIDVGLPAAFRLQSPQQT